MSCCGRSTTAYTYNQNMAGVNYNNMVNRGVGNVSYSNVTSGSGLRGGMTPAACAAAAALAAGTVDCGSGSVGVDAFQCPLPVGVDIGTGIGVANPNIVGSGLRSIDPNACLVGGTVAAANSIVVIGDTAAAILYAANLVVQQVTLPVFLLVEGANNLDVEDVELSDFAATQFAAALSFVKAEKIHPLMAGDTNTNLQSLKHFQYFYGLGVAGDFVSAYYLVRAGPWIPSGAHGNIIAEVNATTQSFSYSDSENIIMNNLIKAFGLTPTRSNLNPTVPSILNRQIVYITDDTSQTEGFNRQLFRDAFEIVKNRANLHTNVTNIQFTRVTCGTSTNQTLHNVTFTSGSSIAITNARVVFKTNAHQYFRIAVTGNLQPRPDFVRVPSQYRAIIPIPLNNPSGVMLQNADHLGDLVTTYIAFSLFSGTGGGGQIIWAVAQYTVDTDLQEISKEGGVYAQTGTASTVLIVEAVNFKNTRQLRYNPTEAGGIFDMHYNDKNTETRWQSCFNAIVATAFHSVTGMAYTGAVTREPEITTKVCTQCPLTGSSVIQATPNTTTGHLCNDYVPLTAISSRETPILTFLQTVSNLFGFNLVSTVPAR